MLCICVQNKSIHVFVLSWVLFFWGGGFFCRSQRINRAKGQRCSASTMRCVLGKTNTGYDTQNVNHSISHYFLHFFCFFSHHRICDQYAKEFHAYFFSLSPTHPSPNIFFLVALSSFPDVQREKTNPKQQTIPIQSPD